MQLRLSTVKLYIQSRSHPVVRRMHFNKIFALLLKHYIILLPEILTHSLIVLMFVFLGHSRQM